MSLASKAREQQNSSPEEEELIFKRPTNWRLGATAELEEGRIEEPEANQRRLDRRERRDERKEEVEG